MNERFEEMDKRFQVRLKETILKLLKRVKRDIDIDIDISKIEWIELFDEEGEVFTKKYRTDVDVLIRDGLHFLMEIKYKADNRDIYHFLKVAELYTIKYQRPNKLLLLTLEINQPTLEYAEQEHIEVITGDFDLNKSMSAYFTL